MSKDIDCCEIVTEVKGKGLCECSDEVGTNVFAGHLFCMKCLRLVTWNVVLAPEASETS